MKTQVILLLFFVTLVLRRVIPFVDLFYVFLVARLLLEPNRRQAIISLAISAAFIMSFLADSPIGLLPLLLSVSYLIFSSIASYLSAKGTTLATLWIGFATLAITFENVLRMTLTTAGVSITSDLIHVVTGTIITILVITFAYSFKRKI